MSRAWVVLAARVGVFSMCVVVGGCHDTFVAPDTPDLKKVPHDFGVATDGAAQEGDDLAVDDLPTPPDLHVEPDLHEHHDLSNADAEQH